MGLAVAVEAQVLFYQINNNSTTQTWQFGMEDANGNTVVHTINPTGQATGTIFGAAVPPLNWKGQNSANCGASGTINAFGSGSIPLGPCISPFPGPGNINYTLGIGGFGVFFVVFDLP